MIEINVPREEFEKLRNMKDGAFNDYLFERLKLFVGYLELNDIQSLKRKRVEVEERMVKMLEEIEYLNEFCEKAERDQKRMMNWIEELKIENSRILGEMKKNGNRR